MSQGATAPQYRKLPAIDLIVVHCSGTPSGRRLGSGLGSRSITAARVIDHWHAQRGFARHPQAVGAFNPDLAHIGYHYVIDVDGLIHTGRHPREPGAHVAGHNATSLGICLVGGAEASARYTHLQWQSLKALVDTLLGSCPSARVKGHRDLSPDANGDGMVTAGEWLKTCPGFSVPDWLAAGCNALPGHLVQVS